MAQFKADLAEREERQRHLAESYELRYLRGGVEGRQVGGGLGGGRVQAAAKRGLSGSALTLLPTSGLGLGVRVSASKSPRSPGSCCLAPVGFSLAFSSLPVQAVQAAGRDAGAAGQAPAAGGPAGRDGRPVPGHDAGALERGPAPLRLQQRLPPGQGQGLAAAGERAAFQPRRSPVARRR